jgi:hypothetical protein
MKAFKDFLVESKRTFDFRVRIADHELSGEILDKIERGLAAFDLADISKPKSQPVAHCNEFAALGPVARQQFDVKLNYPATSEAVKTVIHNSARIPTGCIVVRTALEDDMFAASHVPHPEESLKAGVDVYPLDDSAQDHVGFKRVTSLLKELESSRKENQPQAVRNVNDAILAKDLHSEKKPKSITDLPQGNKSPVNTNNPDPRGKKK